MVGKRALFLFAAFALTLTACSQSLPTGVDDSQEKGTSPATQPSAQKQSRHEDSDEHAFPAPKSDLDRMKDVKLYVDHRHWKLKDQIKYAKFNATVEYVSKGPKKEKLIVHFVKNTSPQLYLSIQEEGIQLYDGDVKWNVFNKKKNELMYEFILKNDSMEPDQHELVRVIAAEDGMFAIHYRIEEAPMSQKHRKKWIDLLLKAEVK